MQGEVVEQARADETGEVCASCGRAIGRLEQPFIWGDSIVCFGCHRHLNSDKAAGDAPHADHTFLSDARVMITNRRLVFAGTSYDLALVRLARLRVAPARRWLGWSLACCGLAVALFGLNRHLDRNDTILLGVGGTLLVLGLLWALIARPTFSIILTLPASEHVALRTRSRRYVNRVLGVIAEAIIERGQSNFVAPTESTSRYER